MTRRPLPPCLRCRKTVMWAKTERGKWIALDPAPDPKGNQAAWEDSDGTWKTRQLGAKSDPPWGWEQVYMPHVPTTTCKPQQAPARPPLPKNVIPITAARSRGFVRVLRPHLFASFHTTVDRRVLMFASFDRTPLRPDGEALTWIDASLSSVRLGFLTLGAAGSREHFGPAGSLGCGPKRQAIGATTHERSQSRKGGPKRR